MAWTTPRDWTDGELVNEAMLDVHIRDNMRVTTHLLARKSADQTVNNSAVLVNDTHLLFAVAASEVWWLQAWLMFDGGTIPDIKFHWTLPASATMRWGATSDGDASFGGSWSSFSTPVALLTEASTPAYATIGAGTTIGLSLTGIAVVAGTAGNVQLQWAQNTANASDTIMRTNSCLIGMRLA